MGAGGNRANLIEAEIVTADGRLRTVNAHTDRELFWAVKGGAAAAAWASSPG